MIPRGTYHGGVQYSVGQNFLAVLLVAFLLPGMGLLPRQAAYGADEKEKLPIPRFVSMKHGEVNLRVGPGRRYPIAWVYKRREMPVEIIAEFDVWRKIRDFDGTVGWVIAQAVSGNRTFIATRQIRAVRSAPGEDAGIVGRLEPGVIGKLLECPTKAPDWCRVESNGIKGWMKSEDFWGVFTHEIIQ